MHFYFPADDGTRSSSRTIDLAAEKRIFEEINSERVSHGLSALQWDEHAANAARAHAQLLVENDKLSHQFPGESSLPERLGATGARFTVSAENVARTGFIEDVHPALMGSSGHRANILNSSYNAVGIGVIEEKGTFYVTQDFIFLVPSYSESQFKSAFAEAFNLARKGKGLRPLGAREDPGSMNWLVSLTATPRSCRTNFTASLPLWCSLPLIRIISRRK